MSIPWAGEAGIEKLPALINPLVARGLGLALLPSVALNPDREHDWQRYAVRDLVDHSDKRETRRMFDHSSRRVANLLERPLVTRLDQALPIDSGDVSVSRVRYMGLDVDGGWHTDEKRDYRFVVGLLGAGTVYTAEQEFDLGPGDVLKIDNTKHLSHKGVSKSQHRVVLVYGRLAPTT